MTTQYAIVARDGRVLATAEFASAAWLAVLQWSHDPHAECVPFDPAVTAIRGGRLVSRNSSEEQGR